MDEIDYLENDFDASERLEEPMHEARFIGTGLGTAMQVCWQQDTMLQQQKVEIILH